MNKTRQKLSIVALLIAVIVCFTAAILGLTATPSAKVSADTAKTYYMISGKGQSDGWTWSTEKEPAEGATKVTITFKIVSKSVAGRHFQLWATDGTESKLSTLHGAYQFGSWFPEGGTVTFIADLTAKTYKVYGTDGKTELLDCTFNTSNKFGGKIYKSSTSSDVIGLYEIVAVDDTGKDLGLTTSSKGITITTEKVNTVSFNSEGTVVSKQFAISGQKVSAPNDPAKDGHYFVGWFTEETFENKYDFNSEVTSDITLYAKFAKAVTYSMITDRTAADGFKWMTKEAPTEGATKVTIKFKTISRTNEGRHHCLFATDGTNNVSTAASGAQKFSNSWFPVGGTVTYVVDLVNKTYILYGTDGTSVLQTFNKDLGTSTQFGAIIYHGYNSGYLYVEGLFEIIATDDYGKDLGVTTTESKGVTIVDGKVNAVTLDEGDGKVSKVYVADGAVYAEPTVIKDGHIFKGWYTDSGFTTAYDFSQAVNSDITLFAKWVSVENVKTYTVAINSEAIGTATKHFEASSRLPRSADATKVYIEYTLGNDDGAGHSFLFDKCAGTMVSAWRTTDLWNNKDAFTQENSHVWGVNNAALYTASYKVIFDLETNQMIWYRGTNIILEGTGTDFASAIQFGLFTNTAAGEGSMSIKIYDDMGKDLGVTSRDLDDTTITFPKATFDVNYDGGEDVIVDVTKATISAPSVQRAGYKFLGWYSDAECTTELVIPAEVTSDFTAYAKWELNEFTVNFNTNGGTAVDAQTVIYNGKATVPVAPTMDGYYFDGWYADEDLTAKYDFDSAITADITVYAKWIGFDAYYANIVSTGAPSIKINENTTSGIRFATAVNNDLLAQLTAEGYTYTVGTLIVPFDYVGANAPTMELLDSEGKGYYNIVSTFDGTTDVFYGTLQSLKESNYGRKWVGLGYVAIDMGDDGVKYIYSAFDQANALSIYDVAESFYNEYKDVADEEENVEVAKYYIDSVVALDADYAVIDKVTDAEIPYEVAIVENVVTVTVKEGYDFVIKSVTVNGKIAKVEIAAGGKSATYQIA